MLSLLRSAPKTQLSLRKTVQKSSLQADNWTTKHVTSHRTLSVFSSSSRSYSGATGMSGGLFSGNPTRNDNVQLKYAWSKPEATFEPKRKTSPSPSQWHRPMVDALSKGDFEGVCKIWETIPLDAKLTASEYSIILRSLVRMGYLASATSLSDLLLSNLESCKPKEVMTLVKSMARCYALNKQHAKVEQLFAVVGRLGLPFTAPMFVGFFQSEPSEDIRSVLAHFYKFAEQKHEELWTDTVLSCVLNRLTFICAPSSVVIVDGPVRKGEKEFKELIASLEQKVPQFGLFTSEAILGAFAAGILDAEFAEVVHQKMIAAGLPLRELAVEKIMHGLMRRQQFKDALKWFNELKQSTQSSEGWVQRSKAYSMAIAIHHYLGDTPSAIQLYEEGKAYDYKAKMLNELISKQGTRGTQQDQQKVLDFAFASSPSCLPQLSLLSLTSLSNCAIQTQEYEKLSPIIEQMKLRVQKRLQSSSSSTFGNEEEKKVHLERMLLPIQSCMIRVANISKLPGAKQDEQWKSLTKRARQLTQSVKYHHPDPAEYAQQAFGVLEEVAQQKKLHQVKEALE